MNNLLWSNLSNSLKDSGAPILSAITSNIMASMPEFVSADPTNLFSLNNSIVMTAWDTNPNDIDNNPTATGEHSWTNTWSAELKWDLVGDFSWNISDIIDPLTGYTTFIKNNPAIETYGTVEGAFTWYFNEDFWFKVSGYVDPARAKILDASYWMRVQNYPTWWVKSDEESAGGACMGLKSQTFPVHAQIWLDFGYPTCAFSLGDFFSWDVLSFPGGAFTWGSLKQRYNDTGFICKSKEQGNSHDNKTPLFDFTALEHWAWEYEIIPFVCLESRIITE